MQTRTAVSPPISLYFHPYNTRRYELIPLSELGRPRVDVLCNMSGIFRDSFQNVVELLDDMFRRAAEADEPEEMNFVRKHALAMTQTGLQNASARLFSNPAGDYGEARCPLRVASSRGATAMTHRLRSVSAACG